MGFGFGTPGNFFNCMSSEKVGMYLMLMLIESGAFERPGGILLCSRWRNRHGALRFE